MNYPKMLLFGGIFLFIGLMVGKLYVDHQLSITRLNIADLISSLLDVEFDHD